MIASRRVAGVLAGMVALGLSTGAQAAPVSGQGTWESTLLARDANGNPVALLSGTVVNPSAVYIYDTDLDITWRANAREADWIPWANARAWADSLSFTVGGTVYKDWRLPEVNPINGSTFNYGSENNYDGSTDTGYNISAPGTTYAGAMGSELAHMFYVTLGNNGWYDTSGNSPQLGYGLSNTGPFNLQSYLYWSGTEYAPDPRFAWYFNTTVGKQYIDYKEFPFNAWAVHDGDVAAVVPLPAGLPLLLTALASFRLLGARRRG